MGMIAIIFFVYAQYILLVHDETIYVIPRTQPAKKTKKPKAGIVTHPKYNGPLQRIFQRYPQLELPCVERGVSNYEFGQDGKHGKVDAVGMFFTKIPKCSSSTLAGIAVQIARNTAARRKKAGIPNTPKECLVKANHGLYDKLMLRDKNRSMLWTFLREPAKRQVSAYFHFQVSRLGYDAKNDTAFRYQILRTYSAAHYMTGYVMRAKPWKKRTLEEKVGYVMDAYDFIGLVERYHESLILLKMIFNLELRDILYTSAKRSGGYDDGEFNQTCTLIVPSVVSPEMKAWFQNSTEWSDFAALDILLYRVIDKSIDLTIDAFGREEVQRQVAVLERALQYTDEMCGPTVILPCSANGTRRRGKDTTCVDHDWACGHKCIETLDLSQFDA